MRKTVTNEGATADDMSAVARYEQIRAEILALSANARTLFRVNGLWLRRNPGASLQVSKSLPPKPPRGYSRKSRPTRRTTVRSPLVPALRPPRALDRLRWGQQRIPRRLPAEVFRLFTGEAGTYADSQLGQNCALHPGPGLVPPERAADRCESATAVVPSSEQRSCRMFQRGRSDDLGSGLGTLPGALPRCRSMPSFRLSDWWPRARRAERDSRENIYCPQRCSLSTPPLRRDFPEHISGEKPVE